jgi:hypothetical protein
MLKHDDSPPMSGERDLRSIADRMRRDFGGLTYTSRIFLGDGHNLHLADLDAGAHHPGSNHRDALEQAWASELWPHVRCSLTRV